MFEKRESTTNGTQQLRDAIDKGNRYFQTDSEIRRDPVILQTDKSAKGALLRASNEIHSAWCTCAAIADCQEIFPLEDRALAGEIHKALETVLQLAERVGERFGLWERIDADYARFLSTPEGRCRVFDELLEESPEGVVELLEEVRRQKRGRQEAKREAVSHAIDAPF